MYINLSGMNTDDTSEVMYSTADVAKLLKVGSPMVRKWAIAYEGVADDVIRLKSKRDGRFFTAEQVNTISAAKKLVDIEGVKIETALKMVTGQPQLAAAVIEDDLTSSDIHKALETILDRNDKTNQALLEEIRGLRQDLASRAIPQAVKTVDSPGDKEDKYYSPLQLLVKRLFGV